MQCLALPVYPPSILRVNALRVPSLHTQPQAESPLQPQRETRRDGECGCYLDACESLEVSLKARRAKGRLLDRDTLRLELANLYLERAVKVAGPSGSSGCTNVSAGRAHITTILGHTASEVAAIQVRAKQVGRKIESRARELGCA